VIITSYGATLAADWGRRVRDTFLLDETWTNIRPDVRAANRWLTPEGGGMVTAGAGGPITGRGGHLLIIDDPYENWQQAQSQLFRKSITDWFQSTLYTRAEPGATIILIQTRWHQDDLTGWLMDDHSDEWDLVSLPAIAEENDLIGRPVGAPLCAERYDLDALMRIKGGPSSAGIGSMVWSGMYQQRPSPAGGNIFRLGQMKFWTDAPETFDTVLQSWDMAFKDLKTSSFVVGQVWGRRGADCYLLDQVRERMDFVTTVSSLRNLSAKWPEARLKLVEDKANGPAVISALQSEVQGLVAVTPRGSKEARAHAVSPLFEAGNVHLPHHNVRQWVREYIDEMTNFPAARNDDQVDATTQALDRLDPRRSSRLAGNIRLPDMSGASNWRLS